MPEIKRSRAKAWAENSAKAWVLLAEIRVVTYLVAAPLLLAHRVSFLAELVEGVVALDHDVAAYGVLDGREGVVDDPSLRNRGVVLILQSCVLHRDTAEEDREKDCITEE